MQFVAAMDGAYVHEAALEVCRPWELVLFHLAAGNMRIRVQSRSSGLHGLHALLSPCPCLLTYESVDQSGVHHFHRFRRDHLRISVLQVNHSRLKNFGKSTL